MTAPFYESDDAVEQYLLFHYGAPAQICPLLPWAREACGFPVRCVSEPLAQIALTKKSRALDLGCAVGRSTFELARHFDHVLGLDYSHRFIAAARHLQESPTPAVSAPREGALRDQIQLELPPDLPRERVTFQHGDACALPADLGPFDLVLMANLIDRLPDPLACLERVKHLVAPGGWLVITSPYTWLEEYTPRKNWLAQKSEDTRAALQRILAGTFALRHTLDLPFLIREHRRKFQLSIAEATLWQK